MNSVAVAAGICVLAAYLVGSVPFVYLQRRSRLRRDLRRLDHGGGPPPGASPTWIPPIVEVAVVLATASVAWRVVASVSPGHGSPDIVAGVATFSDQVLVPWQSVALWAGLAAAMGLIAPVWLDFRGSSGLAPAVALLATGFGTVSLVGTAWVAWVLDLRALWGVPNGPEACLWSAALGAAVFAATRPGRG